MTLPAGWSMKALRDVVTFNPRHPKDLPDTLNVSFIPMPAVSTSGRDLLPHATRPLAEIRKGYTHFSNGDVLFAKITPCMENGKAAVARHLAGGVGCGTTELHVMRPGPEITPEWLYFYIWREPFRKVAEMNMTGTAGQLRVPLSFLESQEIPVPPSVDDQRRITSKLDQIATRLDEVKARLATVPAIISRFRRSVIAAACSGRLTAQWRRDHRGIETAGAMIRRLRVKRCQATHDEKNGSSRTRSRLPIGLRTEPVIDEREPTLPSGWCITRVADLCDCLDHLRIPVNKDTRSKRLGNIPYFGANGQVGWIDRHLFDEPLVLVVEDETFIGREKPFSYIIRGKAWVNNHAHVLRPCGEISVEYLNICLAYYDFVPLTSGTTGRRKLNQDALMHASIVVAPVQEQREIVRQVSDLMRQADAIEARYNKAMSFVDKLMPAILAKAFRGELIA